MNQTAKLDKKKDPATIRIHALSHDGRGIGTLEQKTTFVRGALPEETVTYRLHQKRPTFNEGEALTILSASPNRTVPACEHFGVCGGCSLQHMSADLQLSLKQQTLLEQLKHFGQVIPEAILPPLHANMTGYRRKARLGVKFVIKKDKVLVGFREKSSRYLADLERCIVLHPRVGEHLNELKNLIASLAAFQHIPQIEVAIGDEEVALIFRHLQPLCEEDINKLISFGQLHQFHIYLQPTTPASVHKIWPQDEHQRLRYSLADNNIQFLFHPLDFTQVNLEMNRLMVKQAIALLDIQKEDTVLDLFCGIGNFTLPIAKHAHHVTGVEGGEEMVKRGFENAAHNTIHNVTFHAANLMEPNPQAVWLQTKYDKILLDPPRAGAKEILPFLQALGAKRIVYVSCNPATLARDAGELVQQHGYRLIQAGVMNMFPHTAHIEAMAVFEKK